MKTKTIPFDLEIAKKIQAGEIKGKIKTRVGEYEMKIICFNGTAEYNGGIQPIIAQEVNYAGRIYAYFEDGSFIGSEEHEADLVLEVPGNEPQKRQFNPFDRVLVRDEDDEEWQCAIFSHTLIEDGRRLFIANPYTWAQCVLYDGHEYLVGTTDKPKELC